MGSDRDSRYEGGLPRRPAVSAVKTAVFLLFCVGMTGSAFFVLAHKSLRPAHVDAAHAEMKGLVTRLAARMADYSGELPLRLLTDSARVSTLPPGSLPRNFSEFLGSTSDAERRPIADPWGQSYLLIATGDESEIQLTCVCAGPNRLFETAPGQVAPKNDDLSLLRRVRIEDR